MACPALRCFPFQARNVLLLPMLLLGATRIGRVQYWCAMRAKAMTINDRSDAMRSTGRVVKKSGINLTMPA